MKPFMDEGSLPPQKDLGPLIEVRKATGDEAYHRWGRHTVIELVPPGGEAFMLEAAAARFLAEVLVQLADEVERAGGE